MPLGRTSVCTKAEPAEMPRNSAPMLARASRKQISAPVPRKPRIETPWGALADNKGAGDRFFRHKIGHATPGMEHLDPRMVVRGAQRLRRVALASRADANARSALSRLWGRGQRGKLGSVLLLPRLLALASVGALHSALRFRLRLRRHSGRARRAGEFAQDAAPFPAHLARTVVPLCGGLHKWREASRKCSTKIATECPPPPPPASKRPISDERATLKRP